jgi:hypothetical protein
LNPPKIALSDAEYPSVATTAVGAEKDLERIQKPPRTAAIRKLIMGPAAAIRTSNHGSFGSSDISETPPKKNRVILEIGNPFLFAIIECDNSWIRTETKRSMAQATPIIQYVAAPRPG